MKIDITNRFTGDIIFSHEAENNTIKLTVEAAVKTKVSLSDSDLRGSNLRGSDLRGSNLSDSDLSGSNLRGSNLRGSDLRGSNLSDSDLRGSNLSDSNLRGSDLRGSDLRGSDLSDSDLRGSNLRGSDLRGSNLSGSDLSDSNYGKGIPLTCPPLQILGLEWPVFILDRHIKIGCQIATTTTWEKYTDDEITVMAQGALVFWQRYKDMILLAAKVHQKGAE